MILQFMNGFKMTAMIIQFMDVQEIAFYTTILNILKRRRDAQGDNQEPAGIAVL